MNIKINLGLVMASLLVSNNLQSSGAPTSARVTADIVVTPGATATTSTSHSSTIWGKYPFISSLVLGAASYSVLSARDYTDVVDTSPQSFVGGAALVGLGVSAYKLSDYACNAASGTYGIFKKIGSALTSFHDNYTSKVVSIKFLISASIAAATVWYTQQNNGLPNPSEIIEKANMWS